MSESDLRAGLARLIERAKGHVQARRETIAISGNHSWEWDGKRAWEIILALCEIDDLAAFMKAVPAQEPDRDAFERVGQIAELMRVIAEPRPANEMTSVVLDWSRQLADLVREASRRAVSAQGPESVKALWQAFEAGCFAKRTSPRYELFQEWLRGRAVPPAAQSEYEELVSAVLAYSTSPRETWTHRGIVDLADAHAQDSQTMDKIESKEQI